MKPKTFRYISISKMTSSSILEFLQMEDLARFAENNHIKDIFVVQKEIDKEEQFALLHQNAILQHGTDGFQSIEDYFSATEKKFPNAQAYYEALKDGYQIYDHYKMMKEAGINNKATFDKMELGGFIEGFKQIQLEDEYREAIVTNEISNAFNLYSFATGKGFESFHLWSDAVKKGFGDKDTYDIAKEYGFPDFVSYEEARKCGFKTYKELDFAHQHNVRDIEDMRKYIDLHAVDCKDCSFDQRIMITLLSKIEQGKRISINKAMDLFEKCMNEYRYQDTGEMPAWFTISLNNKEAIIQFLGKNEEVKKFGTFDYDGEFFEINHLKDRKIVLDGSNVAHNSNGKDSKPCIENMIKVVKFLMAKGFTEISVIVDASLRHKLADMERLPELEELAEYLTAPAENSADSFIIMHVKHSHCLFVSNDTFREWKVGDPWVAENIDFYRLSFMIKGDEVIMPDVK